MLVDERECFWDSPVTLREQNPFNLPSFGYFPPSVKGRPAKQKVSSSTSLVLDKADFQSNPRTGRAHFPKQPFENFVRNFCLLRNFGRELFWCVKEKWSILYGLVWVSVVLYKALVEAFVEEGEHGGLRRCDGGHW